MTYTIVKSALSNELIDFITQYALFDEIQDYTPDNRQVPTAHSKYADPTMETLLLKLHPLIEGKTNLTLYPTYSYFRVYRNGDKLDPHVDREACEISVSLCFNYSYENYDWPIFIGEEKVILNPGDLVIYKGHNISHRREPLTYKEKCYHVQGFFHYVDANGPYSDFKYDKRNQIGELPKVLKKWK
jgi:hypothetical protein